MVTGKYVEKGSRFIAYAKHVLTEKEAIEFVEVIRKEHHKARHLCYAYTVGTLNEKYRVNDDGEPTYTAGQPILNQIRKNGLNYIVVAVVRYFGGVLLGKGGLIQAYSTSTSAALETAQIVEKPELINRIISFHISHYTTIIDLVKKNRLIIVTEDFEGEICKLEYLTEPELAEKIELLFQKYCI